MEELKLDKISLRKFGIIIGIAFLALTILILARHRHSILPSSVISLVFFALAILAPILLKPVYIFWMRLAFILSWVNTRLILFIIFYLLFTPIGFMMRLFVKDPLDRKIDKIRDSYWNKKEKNKRGIMSYEKQF